MHGLPCPNASNQILCWQYVLGMAGHAPTISAESYTFIAMPTFAYQARDAKGERTSGAQEATDQRAALEALRAAGLFVTKLEAAKNGTAHNEAGSTPSAREAGSNPNTTPEKSASQSPLQPPKTTTENRALPPRVSATNADAPLPPRYFLRANSKDMALFFRQMHAMLNSGTSLAHALNTMATNAPSHALQTACAEMNPRVSSGTPLSELMKSYPGIFSPLMTGMMHAGEVGGFLDKMCLRLSEYAERDYEIQQTIKRETWYPKLLLCGSFLIPAVVPAAIAWFQGGNALAALARALMLPATVALVVILAVRFKNYLAPLFKYIAPLTYAIDQIKLLVPIAGKTTRALSTAKFCRALGALQAAGMGVQQTINLSADACGNAVIAENSRKIISLLEGGATMTDALESTRQFPGIAIQMMRTGEATGDFDEQLEKVADFLEADAETTIKQSVVVLGIVIFLFMAVYIGMTVIRQYVGIYGGMIDDGIKMAE
jgi:type II secretory pathway component PulF